MTGATATHGGHRKRPMPDDFAQMRATLGGQGKLARHYKANWETVRRWVAEAGLQHVLPPPPAGWNKRPLPDDFAQVASRLTVTELGQRYSADFSIIRRWCQESGVVPPKGRTGPKHARHWRGNGYPEVTVLRNYGPVEEAADILRCHMPVYRCDERGRAQQHGKLWRVGNAVVDGETLIVRAERYRKRVA